jgi:hypothetical protein
MRSGNDSLGRLDGFRSRRRVVDSLDAVGGSTSQLRRGQPTRLPGKLLACHSCRKLRSASSVEPPGCHSLGKTISESAGHANLFSDYFLVWRRLLVIDTDEGAMKNL